MKERTAAFHIERSASMPLNSFILAPRPETLALFRTTSIFWSSEPRRRMNLVKQSEQSKIQEAMDSMDIQIVDPADLPDEDKPVAPRKKLIVAIGFVIGVLLSMGYGLLAYRRAA